MATEIKILNFKRKKGKLYFISKNGDLVEMIPGTSSKKVVVHTGIQKQRGYLYFLNKKGNIGKAKMKNFSN